MLFDVSNIDSSTPAKSSLHPQGIAELLRHYPDKQFVDNLVAIARYGTRVGYEGPSVRTQRPNHSSAYSNFNVINETIQSELAKGRIMEIPSLPSRYFCSPIGLVPKKSDCIQIGWRTIFDLSCPEFASVNDGIPKEYGAIIYETLQDAMNLVAKAGRGATMMKRDLKSAFRHIPVNYRDHWLLIFEWQGKYYADLFLPFGLRTAPRIFNLFSEALHWIFETLFHWNLTHYLDDFLFVFKPKTDLSPIMSRYNETLTEFGLTAAPEKDMNGTTVTHLGFEFDSLRMEVRLPRNKHSRALHTVTDLLKAKSITYSMLDEALGFLSHCCQVVPLGRPFLRNIFSAIRRIPSSRPFRTRLSRAAKKDLKWWLIFLSSWSTISVIQLSRINHDVATDASGKKGIGGIYNKQLFSDRVPARHRQKHINWKEMFAILHAFILCNEQWATGRVRLACDNAAVVQGINKRSINGPALRPLQTILLLAALFDIELIVFWIPSEENIVADAASRHQFDKLANLGFQDQIASLRRKNPATKISALRQKLHSYFTTQSRPPPDAITTRQDNHTNPCAPSINTHRSLPPSKRSHIGLPYSCKKSNPIQLKDISTRSAPSMSKMVSQHPYSTTPASTLSSGAANGYMAKESEGSDYPSPTTYFSRSSGKSAPTLTASTSNAPSAWHLPDSYDVVNLRGSHGNHTHHLNTPCQGNTSNFTQTAQSPSPSLPQKPIPIVQGPLFNSPQQSLPYALSELSPNSSAFIPKARTTHYSQDRSVVPSIDNSSSTKSKNYSSRPASVPSDSPGTPSARERLCLQRPMVSQRTISNCLADGKATPSTSTSLNYPNTIKSTEIYNLTQNFITHSIPQNKQLQPLTSQAPCFPGLAGSNSQNLLPCTNSLPCSSSHSSRCPAALQASLLQPRTAPGM